MRIDLEKPILDKNDTAARANRELLDAKGVLCIDLLSSPGSGKTTTIQATIEALSGRFRIGVIEGDIASSVDTDKLKACGTPAVQINTGGLCHLEAAMVRRALEKLPLDELDLVIIENVGNLVCPVDFYLGEHAKVMILSVPEGDDKPLKYPGIFQAAQAVIINKIDVKPYFTFDEELFREHVGQLNPGAPVFALAAVNGQGVDSWAAWLVEQIERVKAAGSTAADAASGCPQGAGE